MRIVVDKEVNKNLKAIYIFYARSNKSEAALFDAVSGKVISFNNERPYHPCGGMNAIKQIIIEGGGLVLGSEVYGIDCIHCHGITYRLESDMPPALVSLAS